MDQNNRQPDTLEQAVLATLAYFDIFHFPLTSFEVWRYLYAPNQQYRLLEVREVLQRLVEAGTIATRTGLYFLPEHADGVEQRFHHYNLAEKKFAIALRATHWIRHLPFVKLVAVCNSLGFSNAGPGSDIDFFIVTKRGRLWFARLLVTLLVGWLGIRRHGEKVANRVCLSFYVSDEHLNLSDIALSEGDPYLVYWLATLVPLYDRGVEYDGISTYEQLLQANQQLRNALPHFNRITPNMRRYVLDPSWKVWIRRIDEQALTGWVGDRLEHMSRRLQQEKMKHNVASIANHPDRKVVIDDTMLKFHEHDRRAEYRSRWNQTLEKLRV